jgi:hypothetical protein
MDLTVFKSAPPDRPLGQATLAAAAAAGATAITLSAGGATTLGSDFPYYATLFIADAPDVNEPVVVTGAVGDVVSLESALVGNWASGGPIVRLLNSAYITTIHEKINAVEAAMDSGEMTSLDVAEDGAIGGNLDVTGVVTASGGLVVADGTSGAPGIAFDGNPLTGLVLGTNGNVYVIINGAQSKSFADGQDITVRYANTPKFKGARANGTPSEPSDTEDGSILFDVVSMGFANGALRDSAVLRFMQDGAVSGSYVPAKLLLVARNSAGSSVNVCSARPSGFEVHVALAHQGSTLGFFNTSPTTKPAITGWSSKTDAQKVEAVKDALVALGLVAVS